MTVSLEFPEYRDLGAAVRSESTQDFLGRVLGSHETGTLSRSETTLVVDHGHTFNCGEATPGNFPGGTVSLMVQAAHQAYSCHLGYGLRPEVVWYAVVSEISEHIRQNSEHYRTLLGAGPTTIRVYAHSIGDSFDKFHEALVSAVGAELSALFVPSLSTLDDEANIALTTAFMEAAGPYHNYQVATLCGIGHIEIEGTPQDWQLLRNNVEQLKELIPTLTDYLEGVYHVLHNIYCTVAGRELNLGRFWEDLYKWHDSGSGGSKVQGWITALFAHRRDASGRQLCTDWRQRTEGFELGQFASHVSTVPIFKSSATKEPTVHLLTGVLGVEHHTTTDSGITVLTPRLGWGTAYLS